MFCDQTRCFLWEDKVCVVGRQDAAILLGFHKEMLFYLFFTKKCYFTCFSQIQWESKRLGWYNYDNGLVDRGG